MLKQPHWHARPTGIAQPDILVQCDKDSEVELGEQQENQMEVQVREVGGIINPPYVCVHRSVGMDGKRRLEDIRPIMLHGLPGDEEMVFPAKLAKVEWHM